MNTGIRGSLSDRLVARTHPRTAFRPRANICSVGVALPEHYYAQDTLLAACQSVWNGEFQNPARVDQLHRSVRVQGRHLALSLEEMRELGSFTQTNAAYIRRAVELGCEAVTAALEEAEVSPRDVDHILFVSITGLAAPSIDARVAQRLGFRPDVKRTPVFGLGCVAGAAGLARAADYLRGGPDEIAVLLSVELCSLTFQRGDTSVRNLIATGLFGDGAAAVVLGGRRVDGRGPRVLASRSVLYPDTEEVMGWDFTSDGFRIVLSADVPKLVREQLRGDIDGFLATHGLCLGDIESWVCHPGGPKVLEALQDALDLPRSALTVTWESLQRVGNLSSASVLLVLHDTMRNRRPRPGSFGMLVGMGPGFCSELVLLQW